MKLEPNTDQHTLHNLAKRQIEEESKLQLAGMNATLSNAFSVSNFDTIIHSPETAMRKRVFCVSNIGLNL